MIKKYDKQLKRQIVKHRAHGIMNQLECSCHLLRELGLEEVDVLGEIEGIFPGPADHVGVQDLVGLLEHLDQVLLVLHPVQGALQYAHQQVDHLPHITKDMTLNVAQRTLRTLQATRTAIIRRRDNR